MLGPPRRPWGENIPVISAREHAHANVRNYSLKKTLTNSWLLITV